MTGSEQRKATLGARRERRCPTAWGIPVLLVFLAGGVWAADSATVFYDAQVFTGEPDHPFADAVAIRGDRILEPAGTRFVTDIRAVTAFFSEERVLLQGHRASEFLRLLNAPATKALGPEYERSKAAFSVASTTG